MQRRLEIARTLIHEPEDLFLDKLTIGLDPQTRVHIWAKRMKEEHETTIFLITHHMDEVRLADRIATIGHGKIMAEGTSEGLKKLVGNGAIYIRIANGKERTKV